MTIRIELRCSKCDSLKAVIMGQYDFCDDDIYCKDCWDSKGVDY